MHKKPQLKLSGFFSRSKDRDRSRDRDRDKSREQDRKEKKRSYESANGKSEHSSEEREAGEI